MHLELTGQRGRSYFLTHASLDALGVASWFGTAAMPALGRLSSGLVPAPGAVDGPHRALVVKAVGTDARPAGRGLARNHGGARNSN